MQAEVSKTKNTMKHAKFYKFSCAQTGFCGPPTGQILYILSLSFSNFLKLKKLFVLLLNQAVGCKTRLNYFYSTIWKRSCIHSIHCYFMKAIYFFVLFKVKCLLPFACKKNMMLKVLVRKTQASVKWKGCY